MIILLLIFCYKLACVHVYDGWVYIVSQCLRLCYVTRFGAASTIIGPDEIGRKHNDKLSLLMKGTVVSVCAEARLSTPGREESR